MYEAGGAGRSGGECSGPESGPECAEAAELRGRVAELAGTVNVATAGLVDAIGRVIELDAWGGGGYRSVEHWVALHCGVSARHARALVRMARRVEQFPQVMGKFREGRLSEDQVRPIPHGLTITDRWGKPLSGPPPRPPPGPPPTGDWRHPTGEQLDYGYVYINKDRPAA